MLARLVLPVLLVLPLAAADTLVVVAETLTGTQAQGGDAAELGRMAQLEKGRLSLARDQLPRCPAAIERIVRQDIGASETELARIAVDRGEEVAVSRRIYRLGPDRIEVRDGPLAMTSDLRTRTATVETEQGVRSWQVRPVPAVRPVAGAQAGPAVCARATLVFAIEVSGRAFHVLVDPTLPNPFPHLRLVGEVAEPLIEELACLPGFPLLVEARGEDLVRRWLAESVR